MPVLIINISKQPVIFEPEPEDVLHESDTDEIELEEERDAFSIFSDF